MRPPSTDGKAITIRKIFSRETSVGVEIHAETGIIWSLLTNSADYPRWNSTVLDVKGTIAKGGSIVLTAAIDPKRHFKLKVKEFVPGKRLVWGDMMGERVYELSSASEGTTNFLMTEKIAGPLFPLFARMIPPFDNAFETFASDLKKEAERKM
jgi:uncharacterized protein YndB with AHSA1/START domain